jgi:probable phosphoglycerate mutase
LPTPASPATSWPFAGGAGRAAGGTWEQALDRIAAERVGSRVAVACHGGVINAYLSHLFQFGYDHLVSVYFTSITVVRAADTRRAVITLNDYAHVMPLEREGE